MIIVNELEHIYNKGTAYEKRALHDVNLKIDDGEFIGLIGHTGSGKSTLIQHLNGILKPSGGSIYFDGEDIFARDYSLKKLRSRVGLVFQYPEHQLFESSVIGDVQFGPKNIGMPSLQVELHAYEALKQVGIGDELLDVSPLELSGGQKRRVAIAGVLARRPKDPVLDEPTAGLDPKGRDDILDQIAYLHRESDITVILVSHSMEDVAKYADRLIVMNRGAVMYNDEPKRVFEHYQELEKVGLAAPQVTYIMHDLAGRGIPVRTDVTTVAEAADEILRAVGP